MSRDGHGAAAHRSRAWGISLVVLALLAVQIEMTARWWTRPFLDGALHYDYDNARFSWIARNGIALAELRTQFGVTEVESVAWGSPAGQPRFYTHHPYLLRVLFQLVVRLLGDAEFVSRVFALLVSAVAVAGAVTAVRLACGNLLASGLGALVMVNIPLFAVFQSCIKYEMDGIALGAWFFVAVAWALRSSGPMRGLTVGLLAFLSVLAHWTALLFVGAVVGWLAIEWVGLGHRAARRPALAALVGVVLGLGILTLTFAWLAGGWRPLMTDLGSAARLRTDASALSLGEWIDRQRLYVSMNFGPVLPWLTALLGLAWTVAGLRGSAKLRKSEVGTRLLAAWVGCSLAAAIGWQLGFPQGSFVHVFWQLWFVVPVAGLVAASVAAAPRGPLRWGAIAASLILVVHLHVAARHALRDVLELQRGTPADIEFLISQRHDRFTRFVFVPMHDEPINDWFTGPIFPYYTDRQVVRFTAPSGVEEGDRLLVLRHAEQDVLVDRLAQYLGKHLVETGCGPRFCAYDAVR